MVRLFRGKIKLRLKVIFLFGGLTIIPLLLVMAVTIMRTRNLQRENAAILNEQIADTASESVKAFVTKQFQILQDIGGIHSEFFEDPKLQDVILERFLFQTEDFVELSIVDWRGKEVAREHTVRVFNSEDFLDYSGTKKFLEVQENLVYLGPVYVFEGRPFFDIGIALTRQEKTFNGAIFAQVDARVIQDVVKNISVSVLKEQGRAYIIDKEGVVIAHPDSSVMLKATNFSFLPLVRALTKDNSQPYRLERYRNEEGQEVLGNGRSITFLTLHEKPLSPGWFVIVEQPTSKVFAAVRKITQFSGATLLIVIAAGIFVSILFARRIVRPIEHLHKILGQFGEGLFNERARIQTNDELEDLANGFNSMAEKLQGSIFQIKKEARILAAERNKLDVIISAISDGVIALDSKRKILFFNKAAEKITAVDTKTVLGQPIDRVIRVFDKTAELFIPQYCPRKTGFEGIIFQKENLALESVSGKKSSVNVITGQVKEGEKIRLGYILTLHDITREKRVEEMKSEFVSVAAHQLRTPLSALKWALRMVLDKMFGPMPSGQQEILERAYEANERMIGLVNDLLSVSRIEEGRYIFKRIETSIEEILKKVLDESLQKIKDKKIQLRYATPAKKIPLILGDPDMLTLAIQNLVDNAISYTASKGQIVIAIQQTDQGIQFTIKDTGIGIPLEQQSRVFTKFFRGKNAALIETNGSGLGLFITRNIIESHQGKLWFESKEKQGSAFSFILPIHT